MVITGAQCAYAEAKVFGQKPEIPSHTWLVFFCRQFWISSSCCDQLSSLYPGLGFDGKQHASSPVVFEPEALRKAGLQACRVLDLRHQAQAKGVSRARHPGDSHVVPRLLHIISYRLARVSRASTLRFLGFSAFQAIYLQLVSRLRRSVLCEVCRRMPGDSHQ